MHKALFLDRDGVINVEKNYLYKKENFEFIEGIFDLCKYFSALNYKIIVVTNQSGIARKYYTEEDFQMLTQWMIQEFEKNDIKIEHVYYCPHHPDITGKCRCRKPEAGMLLDAEKDFSIDLKNSIIVGDKERDIEAGINAGLRESYLFDELKTVKKSKATKIVKSLDEIWKR